MSGDTASVASTVAFALLDDDAQLSARSRDGLEELLKNLFQNRSWGLAGEACSC